MHRYVVNFKSDLKYLDFFHFSDFEEMQFGINYLLPADSDNDRVNIDDAMHLNQEQVFSS